METEKNYKYEKQKEQLIKIAEENFGKEYFEQLEQILSEIENTDVENKFDYTIVTNHKGAFYAYEK